MWIELGTLILHIGKEDCSLAEMEQLYALRDCQEPLKAALYLRGATTVFGTPLQRGQILDFTTYFNGFSWRKWKQYTALEELELRLQVQGRFVLKGFTVNKDGRRMLWQEDVAGTYCRRISAEAFEGELFGFSLLSMEDGSCVIGGAYYGRFSEERHLRVGIVICTFQRETYVRRTMEVLRAFRETHPWLDVLVVDNGRTLPVENRDGIQVIANRNYGGSGGFSRGLLEYAARGDVDYVLLMDDDIVLDVSSLERFYALACHLKLEYRENFIGGAMLDMDESTRQVENSAYRGELFLHPMGQGYILSHEETLCRNEQLKVKKNGYAAWWFCGIPMSAIRRMGYPLPVFIKYDDVEYGLRNGREILTLNGMGVWHEAFGKKQSAIIDYFTDRNTLIISHYTPGSGRWTFLLLLFGRLIRRCLQGEAVGIRGFHLALQDYAKGFEGITAIGADEKFASVRTELDHGDENVFWAFFASLGRMAQQILMYDRMHEVYLRFREEKLTTPVFWRQYLGLDNE